MPLNADQLEALHEVTCAGRDFQRVAHRRVKGPASDLNLASLTHWPGVVYEARLEISEARVFLNAFRKFKQGSGPRLGDGDGFGAR